MDDADRLVAFLNGPAKRDATAYAKKLGDKLMGRTGGCKARSEFWQTVEIDENPAQLVVKQVVEIRIFGPQKMNVH